jgi:hypothetical protein
MLTKSYPAQPEGRAHFANIGVNKIILIGKAVPLHAMEALGGRGGIAPTHS